MTGSGTADARGSQPLEISLLGEVSVAAPGRSPEGRVRIGGAQARAALARLALERATGVSREALAEVLWPGEMPPTWSSVLRTIVSRLRATFVAALPEREGDPLVFRAGTYRLVVPDDTVVDLEAAEAAVHAAAEALERGDAAGARRMAEHASTVLRRPLLPDCEGEWIAERRAHMSGLLVTALETTCRACTAVGDVAAAVTAAEESLSREPLRESTYRALMAAHAAAGNRAAGLRAYQRVRRLLAEELGVDPSPDTEATYVALLGVSPAQDPAAQRGAAVPFVGRGADLAMLEAAWADARSGRRTVVHLTGTAGIGKSRLALELAGRVAADGGRVLLDRCSEARTPSGLFASVIGGLVDSLPPDERPPLPHGEAERAHELLDAAVDMVRRVTAGHPLLLVLDDLHRLDADVVRAAEALVARTAAMPLLVVAVARDVPLGSDVARAFEALRGADGERLRLRPLDPYESRRLVHLARRSSPPVALGGTARRVAAEAAGNPLAVLELTAWYDAAGWPGPGATTPTVPPGIAELAAGIVAGMAAPAQALVHAAAVASHDGAPVALDVVAASAGLDASAALDALDAGLSDGLLTEESSGAGLRFASPVTQQAVLGRISGARRRALHARLAASIEELRADRIDDQAADLAHHLAVAAGSGRDPRVVPWARVAAARARDRGPVEDAARYLRLALDHVPDGDPGTRAEVEAELGGALLALRDPEGERHLLDGAIRARGYDRSDTAARAVLALSDAALAGDLGREEVVALVDDLLADTDLGEGPGRPGGIPPVTWSQLVARRLRLDPAAGVTGPVASSAADHLRRHLATLAGPRADRERAVCAADLAVVAGVTGDGVAAAVAGHHAAMTAAVQGDDVAVEAHLAALGQVGAPADVGARLAERRLAVAVTRGRFDEVDTIVASAAHAGVSGSEATDAAYDLGGGTGLATVERQLLVAAWMREPGTSPAVGTGTGAGVGAVADAALAALVRGDRGRARIAIRALVTGTATLPEDDMWLHSAGVMALVAADLDDAPAAEAARGLLAGHAGAWCGAGYRTSVGPASFHLGRLAVVAGDRSEAERHLRAALDVSTAAGAVPWVALSQAALAGVLDARGRSSDRAWVSALRAEARWTADRLGLRLPPAS